MKVGDIVTCLCIGWGATQRYEFGYVMQTEPVIKIEYIGKRIIKLDNDKYGGYWRVEPNLHIRDGISVVLDEPTRWEVYDENELDCYLEYYDSI